MKKRIFSIVLALVFACMPLTGVYAVPETVEIETTEEADLQSENTQDEASLSARRKLPTPTDLRWNEDWDECSDDRTTPFYGFVSWNRVGNAEGEYIIELFCDGNIINEIRGICYDDDGNGRVGWSFSEDMRFTQSGTYTFKVTAIGDGINYEDSDPAESGEFRFTAPSAVLETPKNVRWDGNRITYTSVKNASDYVYYVYNQYGEQEFSIHGSGKYPLTNQPEITGFDMSVFINNIIPNEYPHITKIYVSVIAVTYDINKYQNSDESAKSNAKMFVEHEEDMTSSLENALSDVQNEKITAEQALDNFKSFMEDSGSTNVDLALNMMKDETVANNIDTLEEKFIEQTGIEAKPQNTASDPNYLADRGIDVNDISIKGAALNSKDGQNVNINFSEADPSHSADPKFYKNSVAVNIGATGVENSQKLDIPVIIEMPVPTGVVPHRLFILHYHADGSVEQIHPAIIEKGGKNYARFILTSFSTFIFCNAQEDVMMGNVYAEDESDALPAEVSVKDLVALRQYLAGERDLTPEQLMVANICTEDDIEGATVDVNINEKDVEALAQMLV